MLRVAGKHLGRETTHQYWDRTLRPALRVEPGSEISLSLRDGSNGQIRPDSTSDQLLHLDYSQMDPLSGPIFVEGAHPGDVLAVELLDIALGTWGWSAILPNLGLLSDEYPGPYLKIWDLQPGFVQIGREHRFELAPMLGLVGVSGPHPGKHPSVVPTEAGGNLDVKYVRPGCRLLLPVFVEGALLSLGDGHALQGDGELNGTAIECEADVVIKVDVIRGSGLTSPVLDTPVVHDNDTGTQYRSFLGVGPDLWEAARDASRQATRSLAQALNVSEPEAYALLGIVGELRIHEIVDRPHWVVGCMVPLRLWTTDRRPGD